MGANSTKPTKPFNGCKNQCWDRIKNNLASNIDLSRLIRGEILTIGGSNSTLKCDNCMYVEVFYDKRNGFNVVVYEDSTKKKILTGKGYMNTSKQIADYIEDVYKQVK